MTSAIFESAAPVQSTVTTHAPNKRSFRLKYAAGPLVVDLWEPPRPVATTPILLIHGWGGSGSYWQRTAQTLSTAAPVLVPDLPGTGRSQPVSRPQNMYEQVASLEYLLDKFEIEKVQVVGHSMGGAMALLLADAHPQRIERIVLTSLCFFVDERQEQVYRSIMRVMHFTMRFRSGLMSYVPGLSRVMALRYFYRTPDDPQVLRQGLRDYLELDYDTAVACADNATDPVIEAAGSRVQAPVLLVACREDQVMPVENVDYTAAIIPDCRVQWMEKCGHLPMVEKPDEYMAILRDFLALESQQA